MLENFFNFLVLNFALFNFLAEAFKTTSFLLSHRKIFLHLSFVAERDRQNISTAAIEFFQSTIHEAIAVCYDKCNQDQLHVLVHLSIMTMSLS